MAAQTYRRTLKSRILTATFRVVNWFIPWHRLPVVPGAITLHNYPRFLQELTKPDGSRADLAAIDILRDRERGVPRYNEFRRHLRRRRVKSFEALTKDKRWAREIKEIYDGDIDRVDPVVGLFAENPPKGFGFGD